MRGERWDSGRETETNKCRKEEEGDGIEGAREMGRGRGGRRRVRGKRERGRQRKRSLTAFVHLLLESNILYRKKCKCPNILYCTCPVEKKCDIMIADFDSLKLTSATPTSLKLCGVKLSIGTPYYRAPEVCI